MSKVTVGQDLEAPIAAAIIAEAIVKISAASEALLKAGLKQETIVTLIHDRSKVSKNNIRIVLNNLADLRKDWTTR